MPGVYVVKVTDEKTLQATALVVGSDLDAIVKVSREQVLVFAQDMKTGQGRKGARVLVADGSGVILEKTTGDDGVLLASWDKPPGRARRPARRRPPAAPTPRSSTSSSTAATRRARSWACPTRWPRGSTPRAYIYTDRPAYRPGQEVALRGVVREAKDGQYANPARASRTSWRSTTPGAGSWSPGRPRSRSSAPSTRPSGSTRRRPSGRTGSGCSGRARGTSRRPVRGPVVQAGEDRPRFRPAPDGLLPGRDDQGRPRSPSISTASPVAGRPIEVALPDGRTDPGDDRRRRQVPRRVPDRRVRRGAGAPAGRPAAGRQRRGRRRGDAGDQGVPDRPGDHPDRLPRRRDLRPERHHARRPGQADRPASCGSSVLKQVNQGGRITEREVSKHVLTTDKDDRQGDALDQGRGRAGGRLTSSGPPGPTSSATRSSPTGPCEISGKEDETRLRLLTDRQSFKVGETASVNLHSRSRPGTALLAWEADRILQYQARADQGGGQPADLAGRRAAVPQLHPDRLEDGRRQVRPGQPRHPGRARPAGHDQAAQARRSGRARRSRSRSTTVDQLGRPVAAEVALALVDRSLLRLFNDRLPPIGPFFYDQTRTGAFSTEATNTFRDEPATLPVSEAVVEEAERLAAQAPQRRQPGRGPARRPRRWPNRDFRPGRSRQISGSADGGESDAGREMQPGHATAARRRAGPMRGIGEHGRWRRRGAEADARLADGRRGRRRTVLRAGQGRRWRRPDDLAAMSMDDDPTPKDCSTADDVRGAAPGGSRALARPRQAGPRQAALASRAVRRDGLLEPRRRHRQGRQGDGQVQGADGPVRVPVLGQGRDRGRHAGRPGDLGA